MDTPTPKLLSGYKEISSFLGVSLRSLRRHRKTIPLARFGKRMVILEADLVEWIKKNYKMVFKRKNYLDDYIWLGFNDCWSNHHCLC